MSETEAETSPLPQGGTVRPITRWGEHVMHRLQEPVTAFDDDLREHKLKAHALVQAELKKAAPHVRSTPHQTRRPRAHRVLAPPDRQGRSAAQPAPATWTCETYEPLIEVGLANPMEALRYE